jgi:hypothetical protein
MRKQSALRDLGQITNFSLRLGILLLVSHSLFSTANAQDDKPVDLVPPPLAIVSKGEKSQLEAENDAKKYTQLSIELMDARLIKAAELSSKNQYKESLDELGGFQALLRNAFNFLKRNDNGSKKILNNYKRFEISLRGFMPKLEIIRRDMPIKYGYHVRALMKFVREARANAVEPLFDDSVLSEDS